MQLKVLRRRVGVLRQQLRTPLLTVVMPCHNAGEFVEEAIRSVLNQDLRDLELIVVDDASSDDSRKRIQSLASRDRRIRLIRLERVVGPGAARNIGVGKARGRLLAFVDADDKVLPGAYSALVSSLQLSGSDFAAGGYRRHGRSGSHRPRLVARVHGRDQRAVRVDQALDVLDEPVLWNKVYRMDFWREAVGPIPEDVNYEDQEPALRAALRARTFDLLERDVYSWRLSEGRASRSQAKARLDDLLDRVAVIRRMASESAGASGAVREHLAALWLGRDLLMYARNIPMAETKYGALAQTCAQKIVSWTPAVPWHEIPFHDRALAYALAHSSIEDVEEIVGSCVEDTHAVPIANRGGRLAADPPYLQRIAPLPSFITDIQPVDIELRCGLTRVEWADAETLIVQGYAYIAGMEQQAQPSIRLELVAQDGSTVAVDRVDPRHDPEIDLQANDPWRTCAHSGFSATIWLNESREFRLRAELGIHGHTVSAFLTPPPSFRTSWPGPIADHRRFVARRADDGALEVIACPVAGYRLGQPLEDADNVEIPVVATNPSDVPAAASLVLRGRRAPVTLPTRASGSVLLGSLHGSAGDPIVALGGTRFGLGVAAADDEIAVTCSGASKPLEVGPLLLSHDRTGAVSIEWTESRVTIDELSMRGSMLICRGRHWPARLGPQVSLSSSNTSYPAAMTLQDQNRWEAQFDPTDGALPSGGYFLRWGRSADERDSHWVTAGDLADEVQTLVGDARRVRVVPHPEGRVGLTLGPPLALEESTRFGRQRLIESSPPPLFPAVLFECFSGKSAWDNPRAIFDDLQDSGMDVPCFWSVTDGTVQVPSGATPLVIGSEEWFDIARSVKVIVTNNTFPHWFKKQPGQYLIQTWHGSPIKKLLLHAPRASISQAYRRLMEAQVPQWDLLLAQNDVAGQRLSTSMGYTGEVLVGENPRNVRLLEGAHARRHVRSALGLRDVDRVILYAPTWREALRAPASGSKFTPLAHIERLAEEFEAQILLRSHHMNSLTTKGRRIINVSDWEPLEHLMLASDVLVSDYSSIFFDYRLTGLPGIIYTPDLQQYRDERGLYDAWPDGAPWSVAQGEGQLRKLIATTLQQPLAEHDPSLAQPALQTLSAVRHIILAQLRGGDMAS